MRYFAELAYKGTHFYGWQKQPDQISVQETLDQAFSTILDPNIEVTGCGRTDTGVHAKQYYMHFDFEGEFPEKFINRINKFLPKDIVIYRVFEVPPEAHARFDAVHRAYEYHFDFDKNPFRIDTAYYYHFADRLDKERMQEAAALLLKYEDFFPFCKTNTDVKTMRCQMFRSEFEFFPEQRRMVYHVAANRFLRGMVRLIVGMLLNVGLGKTNLEEVREALEKQQRLKRSYSVPPQGLYLCDIRYKDGILPLTRN